MFMIKSEDQRQKLIKRIEGIENQIHQALDQKGSKKEEGFVKVMHRHLEELKMQLRQYDELKKNGLAPLRPHHLSEIGSYLVKARIFSGLTQADTAKKLGVSQPMVYKYENSEYQGTNLEFLSRVAKVLNVSVDLQACYSQKKTTYDPQKQQTMILYYVGSINNKFLGKTKLMKLLYYNDYEWIQQKGISMSGDTYLAMPYGPIPKHAQQALQQLEKKGVLRVEMTKLADYDQERYLALQDPDLSCFSRQEIEHLNEIARRFEFWTAKQMSDLTHEDWPWLSTQLGKEICF